jgi:hypothetical protein
MTIATLPKPNHSARSRARVAGRPFARSGYPASLARPVARAVLGRYTDPRGRLREVLARVGCAGSVLVIDRDARTLGDRRLVAHLGADEPAENAALICRHYLRDTAGRRCRPVSAEDLRAPDPISDCAPDTVSDCVPDQFADAPDQTADTPDRAADLTLDRASARASHMALPPAQLVGRHGRCFRLGLRKSRLSIPELRWLSLAPDEHEQEPRPVSVRDVVACLESYEPARARTVRALSRHRADPAVSVAVLRAELERMDASRIVLNRGLRDAVLRTVRAEELSMSEIALRCGRVKYDARGNASGETSWLARRVGISPEGGELEPTPWVHSEVLALIARAGLGISPREVELG